MQNPGKRSDGQHEHVGAFSPLKEVPETDSRYMTLTKRPELEAVWDLLLVSRFPVPHDFTNSHRLGFQSFVRSQGYIKEGESTREQVNGY